jgi:hypothetical protein
MTEKKVIYCGSGKKMNDTWIKATINLAKFKDHVQEYKGTKFLKLNINIKDEEDQYGKDVAISIDTWQPDEAEAEPQEEVTDGLPF